MDFSTLSGAQEVGLIAAAIGLALAVIALLTRSTRALNSFSGVLQSYAEIINGLNNELKESYEQRRELRESNEALEIQMDSVSVRIQKAEGLLDAQEQRVVALQKDKGELKDALDDLQAQAEKEAASHAQVVRTLTEKIDLLTHDVAREKQARAQTETDLQAQILELTQKNRALEEENGRLKVALEQATADKTAMQKELADLRTMIQALRNGTAETPAAEPEGEEEQSSG